MLIREGVPTSQNPIFIVGCPRSGTSLLRDLLRAHPNLTFPAASFFIPRLYKAYGEPRNPAEVRKLVGIILRIDWVRRWELELTPSEFASCRSYADIVSCLFGLWARKEGKRRWGDKTPDNIVEIPTIMEIFPSAKIIHIYRDGRDVAVSWMKAGYRVHNLFTAASRWKQWVGAGRAAGATIPANYREVRYETLLAQPETTLREICDFLEEEYYPEMLVPNHLFRRDYPSWIGTREPTHVSHGEVLRSNCGKWKTAMSHSEQVLFESVAGDLLRELGYETGAPVRTFSKAERRWWLIDNRARRLLWQLNTSNKRRWLPSLFILQWASIRYRLRQTSRHAERSAGQST